MTRRYNEIGATAVVGDGSVRAVRVMHVHRSRGVQILACYDADADEGFTFVSASERPRIEVDDVGVITWRREIGRWDFRKGVGP